MGRVDVRPGDDVLPIYERHHKTWEGLRDGAKVWPAFERLTGDDLNANMDQLGKLGGQLGPGVQIDTARVTFSAPAISTWLAVGDPT